MGENLGQTVEQHPGVGIGRALGDEAGDGPVEIAGMIGDVEADTDDDRVASALQQDARDLRAIDQYIIGPFYPRLPGAQRRDEGMNSIGRDQRQRVRQGIAGLQADKGGAIKVADGAVPDAAHPPPAPALPSGAQPTAFAYTGIDQCQHVGIGRYGIFNEAYLRQNKDAAAAALA